MYNEDLVSKLIYFNLLLLHNPSPLHTHTHTHIHTCTHALNKATFLHIHTWDIKYKLLLLDIGEEFLVPSPLSPGVADIADVEGGIETTTLGEAESSALSMAALMAVTHPDASSSSRAINKYSAPLIDLEGKQFNNNKGREGGRK